ncbi:MAG TPA: hypothetical protein G4O02_02535 [Caldilineae bacterium]|nr:hypothetical protein [Caldilineae bacterium]
MPRPVERVLLAMFLLVTTAGCNLLRQEEPSLPIPLEEVLPKGWTPVGELVVVNIDDDGAPEWLLRYRYDKGLIGAVIYDAQSDIGPYGVAQELPYQPAAFLVPYPLLPNTEDDRAIGYIGNDSAEYKLVDGDGDGREDVLLLLGYWYGVPTQLTMVWWENPLEGYRVAQVAGDERIRFDEEGYWTETGRQLRSVFTKRRLRDRSDLCEENGFKVDLTEHQFILRSSTLTFCRGVPDDPIYPEATTLSFLLRLKRATPPDQEDSVFQRLMTEDGRRAWKALFGQHAFEPRHVNVSRLKYEGPLGDRVRVYTVHQDKWGKHALVWQLARQRPQKVSETVTWRIEGVWQDLEEARPECP